MHSTACGAATTVNTMPNSNYDKTNGLKMVYHNDDAMNKIPLKSANGADDDEKNVGEFVHDTTTAEEARREQMRVNLLKWMKKLTIVFICFIGIALISYVVISLCFSDWSKHKSSNTKNTTIAPPTTNSSQITIAHSAVLLPRTTTLSYIETTAQTPATIPTSTPTVKLVVTTTNSAERSSTAYLSFDSSTISTQTSTSTEADGTPSDDKYFSTEKPLLDIAPLIVQNFSSKLDIYQNAAVSCDKEVCSRIGSSIMQQGGGAVDAAIAALLCNGLVSMQSMGIGGGMFMNIFIKEVNQAYTVISREVAPFSASEALYRNIPYSSLNGGLSIAVPGELMGYYIAHKRFGKLDWKLLVEPSLKICEDGFHITQHIIMGLNTRKELLRNDTTLFNLFFDPKTGDLLPEGTKLKIPQQLCNTYKMLAENGPLDFYNGTLSDLVVEDLKELGSIVTAADLEAYTADVINSITMRLGEDVLYVPQPVSSGAVVANVLSILEGYNFTTADLMEPDNLALTIHRLAEALKFGYAKRWELGDLRFHDVRNLISKLTDPEDAALLRQRINDSHVQRNLNDYDAKFKGVEDHGTSHMVVLAPNGDAVSVTSSINYYFGSGQVGKRTGIIFNSAMNDFSIAGEQNLFNLPPAENNFMAARKRPMSSMSPLILATQDGDVRMIIGSSGGSKIIAAIAEVMANVLWFKKDIKQAIDAPRFYHQLVPNILEYEDTNLNEEVINILRSKGQITKFNPIVGTVVNAIVRNATGIYANADYRKRGGSAGF